MQPLGMVFMVLSSVCGNVLEVGHLWAELLNHRGPAGSDLRSYHGRSMGWSSYTLHPERCTRDVSISVRVYLLCPTAQFYDFSLFAYFTAEISRTFLPGDDPVIKLIEVQHCLPYRYAHIDASPR